MVADPMKLDGSAGTAVIFRNRSVGIEAIVVDAT
jgi:hypothetical protein